MLLVRKIGRGRWSASIAVATARAGIAAGSPRPPVGEARERLIGAQRRERDVVGDAPGGVAQHQALARGFQLETQVAVALFQIVVRVQHQRLAGAQRQRRQRLRQAVVVGHGETIQRQRGRARVDDLDPVFQLTVFVDGGAVHVVGHELVDPQGRHRREAVNRWRVPHGAVGGGVRGLRVAVLARRGIAPGHQRPRPQQGEGAR
jgi:hypothetical protein